MPNRHTPGPWLNAGKMKDGRTYIDGDGPVKLPVAIVEYQDDEDTQDANACLIAAAPDLLASVRELINCIDPDRDQAEAKRARAAIAKATGTKD